MYIHWRIRKHFYLIYGATDVFEHRKLAPQFGTTNKISYSDLKFTVSDEKRGLAFSKGV